MWHDNWHHLGHLTTYISETDLHEARIDSDCKVEDMVDGDEWNWPQDWSRKYQVLAQINVPNLTDDKDDCVRWRSKKGLLIKFSTKEIWKDFKEEASIVKWCKAVWYSSCNPRLAFHIMVGC